MEARRRIASIYRMYERPRKHRCTWSPIQTTATADEGGGRRKGMPLLSDDPDELNVAAVAENEEAGPEGPLTTAKAGVGGGRRKRMPLLSDDPDELNVAAENEEGPLSSSIVIQAVEDDLLEDGEPDAAAAANHDDQQEEGARVGLGDPLTTIGCLTEKLVRSAKALTRFVGAMKSSGSNIGVASIESERRAVGNIEEKEQRLTAPLRESD